MAGLYMLIYSNSQSEHYFLESRAKVSKALCDSSVHLCVFNCVRVYVREV